MQKIQTSIKNGVAKINWAEYETAYGNVRDVPDLIIALTSSDAKTALSASHDLWCGLCHQHAYISSASLPSYPFLMQILKVVNKTLAVEILDIFMGFAICSKPSTQRQSENEIEWVTLLRQAMINDISLFENLSKNDDENISGYSTDIIQHLS